MVEKNLREKKEEQKNYGISIIEKWEQYRNFVRNLHLEKPIKKPTLKEFLLKYFGKVFIVFLGSFFPTLTFYFLIDPNGLYNSGLNGLLQLFSKVIISYKNVNWSNYYPIYYSLGLLFNSAFIITLKFFFKANLEIISTSIFYVLSQIFWTKTFIFFGLKKYIFDRFNPAGWKNFISESQLSFTLPYYILIAIVASMIHTFGYSLIFKAKATPGGFDVITSHFSTQKKKSFSVSTWMKFLSIFIIFLVNFINFSWIEDDHIIRKSFLKKEIGESCKSEGAQGKIDQILQRWRDDMKLIGEKEVEKEKQGDIKNVNLIDFEIFEIKEKNKELTNILKSRIRFSEIEEYPQEVEYYLSEKKERKKLIKEELEKILKDLGANEEQTKGDETDFEKKARRRKTISGALSKLSRTENKKLLTRKENLKWRIEKEEENFFQKYLQYITNDEKLWATVVYIFFSSYLMGRIFPRNQMVMMNLYSSNEDDRDRALSVLEKYSPIFYNSHRKSKKENKNVSVFVTVCHLSRWDLYLLDPYLKKLGKITFNESG